jgi:hypothetical protein
VDWSAIEDDHSAVAEGERREQQAPPELGAVAPGVGRGLRGTAGAGAQGRGGPAGGPLVLLVLVVLLHGG